MAVLRCLSPYALRTFEKHYIFMNIAFKVRSDLPLRTLEKSLSENLNERAEPETQQDLQ